MNKSKTPLYDAIVNYNSKSQAKFHMPSHNGQGQGLYLSSQFDVTELNGLDNLIQSNGVITQAEQLMAKAYGCVASYIMTQGGTCAMHTSLFVCSNYGKKVVAFGDMHKSFWAGCGLSNMGVIKAKTINDLHNIFANPTQIDKDISAIYTTSPNYFGNVKDIITLREICNKYNILLVVDEAHGAHFAFCQLMPKAVDSIADMTITSPHKTMAVYGGGALFNVNNTKLIDLVEYYRNILHTTSPNYLVMASLDYARAMWQANAESWYKKIEREIDSISSWGEYTRVQSDDISRLVLVSQGNDAKWTYDKLFDKGIALEMAYQDKLVAIVTPFNVDKVQLLSEQLNKLSPPPLNQLNIDYESQFSGNVSGKVTFVDLTDSLGKRSAVEIGIYPPGIPLITIGDIIDEKAIEIISQYKECIFGLVNNRIPVLE